MNLPFCFSLRIVSQLEDLHNHAIVQSNALKNHIMQLQNVLEHNVLVLRIDGHSPERSSLTMVCHRTSVRISPGKVELAFVDLAQFGQKSDFANNL